MNLLFSLLILCIFACCTNPPYKGGDVCGPDEFVMDSYKIREGKFGILEMEGMSSEPLCDDLLEDYKDLIHDGDVLQIAVYHPSRSDISGAIQSIGATIGFRVTNGKIALPDLEPVRVEGMTLEEARAAIQNEYLKNIHNVEVFISYKDRTERKVELAGMVAIPTMPVDGRIRLFETLAIAKVPYNANFFKSYVVRDGCLLPVDMYRLIKEGDMCQNIVMRGGDKIYIADPSSSNLVVLGEVMKPRVIDLPNGFMTLTQALGEAGGLQISADRRYIQIIRGNIACPKIYTLHWNHLIHLPTDSMLLIPGDIVYVAATPLTEWYRFVNQILPTIIGYDLISKGIKSIGVNTP